LLNLFRMPGLLLLSFFRTAIKNSQGNHVFQLLKAAYCGLNCELEILFPDYRQELRWWGMQSDNSVDYEAENMKNVLVKLEIEKHLRDKL